MTSKLRIALVAVVALLVVTAAPASASHTATITHTGTGTLDDGDLDGVDAEGTLTDGYVQYTGGASGASGAIVDSAEDGDLAEYVGSTSNFRVVPSHATDGQNAIEGDAGNDGIRSLSGLPVYPSAGQSFSFDVELSSSEPPRVEVAYGVQGAGDGSKANGYIVVLDEQGELALWKDDFSTVLDETTVSVPTGEPLTVSVDWGADGSHEIVVEDSSGSTVGTLTATDSEYSEGGIGFAVGGGGGNIAYLDNWRVDVGEYTSTPFVADAETGWTNLDLTNVEAIVEWQAFDGSTWTTVDSATYSTSGNYSVDLPETATQYRTHVTFLATGTNADGRLLDEGVTFETSEPNATAGEPPDGYETQAEATEFTVDVSDPDFAEAHDEELHAELVSSGEVQADTYTSSNGTVSLNASLPNSGEWFWRITDRYGHTVTTESRNITLPSSLYIYNESDPDQLIDDQTVTVQFYLKSGEQLVFERTTDDGSVSMAGIPANQPFVAVANADGYRSRRIFVSSLLDTQSIYLLPTEEEYTEVVFDVRDYTGRFDGEESVLKVQRALGGEWHTVSADYLGASGEVATQLAYNERHRLIAENVETGARRELGAFTPTTSGTEVVRITSSESVLDDAQGVTVSVSPTTRSLPAVDDASVNVTVADPSDRLTSWSARFIYRNTSTGTNTTLTTETRSDPGTVDGEFNLSGFGGDSLFVVVEVETDQGTAQEVVRYSVREQFANDYSLLSVLGEVPDRIGGGNADGVTTFLAVLGTLVATTAAAGTLRMSTELSGLTAVTTLAGFSVIGWIGYGPLFASIVAFLALSGLRRGI